MRRNYPEKLLARTEEGLPALVDELHLILAPILVGAGKRALPEGRRVGLELLDEHRFESGFVHLHYGLRP